MTLMDWLPPILSFAGALGGVGLGAWLTGRRDRDARTHADLTRFHGERLDAYSEFIRHLDAMRRWTWELTQVKRREGESSPDPVDGTAWMRDAAHLYARLQMVADEKVVNAGLTAVMTAMGGPILATDHNMGVVRVDDVDWTRARERGKDALKLIDDAYLDCVNAMRESLGAEPLSNLYRF